MFANLGISNLLSMLSGSVLALILILFILIAAFKSVRIGLISLLPNLLPAVAAFGVWGLLVGEVGASLSIVMSITFGIVVDDTIHFFSKHLRARREKNLSVVDAIRYAYSTVGTALGVTTIILMAGFSILALSSFKMNAGMGLLTAITIGLAIAQEADKRDQGFAAYTSNIKMILKNRQGQESIREIRSKTLEVQGDGDKSLTIFDKPRDVKGTALLSFTHKEGADDQWLYLPALKRVKRISSNNKSGPFMGSEFAYEDITSQEVEKYTYKFIRDDKLDNIDVFIIERYPVDKKSGYTRQIVWMDKTEYIARKVEFFDRKNSPLKTLVFKDYNQYKDKFWRAGEMFMENHQTGKSTSLMQSNYNFGVELNSRDFDKNSLKRVR
jgi:hypothetical protein